MLDVKKIQSEEIWVSFPDDLELLKARLLKQLLTWNLKKPDEVEVKAILEFLQKTQDEVKAKKPDERYKIRFVTDEKIRLEAAKEKQTEKESGKERDPADLTIFIACYACVDWEGITSGGVKLDPTPENKQLIFSKFFGRAAFVAMKSKDEALFLGEKLEDLRKNS